MSDNIIIEPLLIFVRFDKKTGQPIETTKRFTYLLFVNGECWGAFNSESEADGFYQDKKENNEYRCHEEKEERIRYYEKEADRLRELADKLHSIMKQRREDAANAEKEVLSVTPPFF